MPGQEIDHPSLAPDRQGPFRHNCPSRRGEDADDELVHRRVSGVQEAVQVRAVPPEEEINVRAQRGGDGQELVHSHAPDVAAFEADDDSAWHGRPRCDRLLGQIRPDADRPHAPPDPRAVHGPEATWKGSPRA